MASGRTNRRKPADAAVPARTARGDCAARRRLQRTLCAPIPWVVRIEVLYWGDVDLDGLAILASLRSVRPDARSVMMDPGTLQRFAQLATPHAKGLSRAAPTGLLPNEVEAYELLRIQGGQRLEQERIPWDHSLATLGIELGGATPLGSSAPAAQKREVETINFHSHHRTHMWRLIFSG